MNKSFRTERKNEMGISTLNRHLSMSSDVDEEQQQPLRVHVGNIPFLWTIDDLRKQFLVRKYFYKNYASSNFPGIWSSKRSGNSFQ